MNAQDAYQRRANNRVRLFGGGADAMLMGAMCVAIIYLLLILITFKYGRDQGIYAVVGEAILSGGAPYTDAWDFKPPFIFFAYAAARSLFGPGMASIRILEAVGLASLVPAFAILSRRFLGSWRAGLVGGALAVFLHVKLEFWDTAQPESFGGIVTAWALVCATYIAQPKGKAQGFYWKQYAVWVGAGALYTTAALLKPPLGGGFLVSLAVVLDQERRRAAGEERLRRLAGVLVAFALGALFVLGGTLLFFWSRDSLHDLYETFFVFTPQYTALGFEAAELPSLLWRAVKQSLVGFSTALPLGLVFLIALGSRSEREPGGALHVLGVVAFQLLGVALQAKFFDYHYGASLPLLSLLAGWGLWKLWKQAFTDPIRVGVAAVFIGIVLSLSPVRSQDAGRSSMDKLRLRTRMLLGTALPIEVDALHTWGDVSFGANRVVAGWLLEHTPEDAIVYIWGFEPMVYDMAARRPASRYIYNVPQRLHWPGVEAAREELMAELVRAEPEVVMVLRNDVFPDVTGDRMDSWGALQKFSELRRFIDLGYRFDARIQDFMIYVRRGESRGSATRSSPASPSYSVRSRCARAPAGKQLARFTR